MESMAGNESLVCMCLKMCVLDLWFCELLVGKNVVDLCVISKGGGRSQKTCGWRDVSAVTRWS